MTKTVTVSVNEFFGWKNHPFSDLADQNDEIMVKHDQEVLRRAVELLKIGKSFAITGGSGGIGLRVISQLEKQGHSVRVVSMPSMNLFDAQSDEYKESVLPNSCRKRLSVEMLSDFGWHKYVGLDGEVISLDTFGASGKAEVGLHL